MQVYLDNASTSFPKAPGVGESMRFCVDSVGASVSRSGFGDARDAAQTVLSLREKLSELFNLPDVSCAVLTPGATYSLNLVLKGTLRPGDHCIADPLAHNAVARPLAQLRGDGVEADFIPCGGDGVISPQGVLPLIKSNTRLIVLTHASNVTGTIAPLEDIAAIAAARDIPLVVDAAQTAGHHAVDFAALRLAALAVPAHKGLLGPAGIGALLLKKSFAASLRPLVLGGTGSASEREEQPPFMPDRFEPGTLNLPGAYGFEHALSFVLERGAGGLGSHGGGLTRRFIDGVLSIRGARLIGPPNAASRAAVASVDCPGRDNAVVAARLAEEHGVYTRCGLHCAPLAHKALGTFPSGTIRFSPGWANTPQEIDYALEALQSVLK